MESASGHYLNVFDPQGGKDIFVIFNEANSEPTIQELEILHDLVCGELGKEPSERSLQDVVEGSGLNCVEFGVQIRASGLEKKVEFDPESRYVSNKDLVKIRNLASKFYAGADEYMRELEDPGSFMTPVSKILKIVLGKAASKELETIQQVREHLADGDFLDECFGCYPYAVPADKVPEKKLEEIASIAGGCGFIEIHEAALQVLGINPAVKEGE